MDCPFRVLDEQEDDDDDDDDDDETQDPLEKPTIPAPGRKKPKPKQTPAEKEMEKEHQAPDVPFAPPGRKKEIPDVSEVDVVEEVTKVLEGLPPEIRGEPTTHPLPPAARPKVPAARVSSFELVSPSTATAFATMPASMLESSLAFAARPTPVKTPSRLAFIPTRQRNRVTDTKTAPTRAASLSEQPEAIFNPNVRMTSLLDEIVGRETRDFTLPFGVDPIDAAKVAAAITFVAAAAFVATKAPLLPAVLAGGFFLYSLIEDEVAEAFGRSESAEDLVVNGGQVVDSFDGVGFEEHLP